MVLRSLFASREQLDDAEEKCRGIEGEEQTPGNWPTTWLGRRALGPGGTRLLAGTVLFSVSMTLDAFNTPPYPSDGDGVVWERCGAPTDDRNLASVHDPALADHSRTGPIHPAPMPKIVAPAEPHAMRP